MNGSPGTSHLTTVLTVVGIAGVFIAALIIGVRSGRKHEKAVREFAQAQGWSFSRNATQEHTPEVEQLFPDEKFSLTYIMEIERGRRKVYLFDGTYRHRAGRSGGWPASVCLIESERLESVDSRVEIIARNWVDATLLRKQVDMGDSEFARNFIVLSQDAASARRILSQPVQAALLAHRDRALAYRVQIALGKGRAALLAGGIDEQQRWRDLVDLGRAIESAVQ
ncbi:MAG: DUF3137 domain-containing protein [Acidobacteriia bacterium]|nr:DUF3137 domain-containing protein [Terriglobia bacterium]